MKLYVQIRRDLASEWVVKNPVLLDGQQGYETDTGRIKIGDGVTAWNVLAYRFETGGSGVADGDKGDIVVSSSGAVWSLDYTAVNAVVAPTWANVTGKPAAITALSGTNTGDQASIVGITGTKAQFDTAVTDGNFMYVGDAPTSHAHTAAAITDFDTAVAATASVTANTAKVSNATHTGDVTGATALTLATVNSNVGSFGSATEAASFTVNAKGLITAAAETAISVPATAISDSTAAGRAMVTAADAAAQTALLDVATSSVKGLAPASGGGTSNFLRADLTWAAPAGGGVSDGDKGDIVVSSSGAVWSLDYTAVNAVVAPTWANVTGKPAAITALSGTNTGDQTSIAGITGTKAQFDTAVSDGNFMYVGDAPTSHTHTAAAITDFDSAVAATASVTANTAKVSNATHTGDVTGATALTLATVNSNVGSFGSATEAASFTVNAKGLITAAAETAISVPATAISDSTAAGRAMVTAADATAQTALLDVATSSAKGLAPASGGGTSNFLRADLTWAAPAGGGGGGAVDIQEFTIVGTSSWVKPVGAQLVTYLVIGGGGGGGSARLRADTSTAAGGGGGGGAGSRVEGTLPASMLDATETITVGAGGAGGVARTSTANGAAGEHGEASSIGTKIFALGGTRGGAGTTAAGTIGSGGGGNAGVRAGTNLYAANGGAGSLSAGGVSGATGDMRGGGGGGGSGYAAADTSDQDGGAGGQGGQLIASASTATGSGGAAGTSAGRDGGAGAAAPFNIVGGSGGGGGANGGASANGGTGGAGGYPGGGGGGGGAATVPQSSGAGGAGGDGYVLVITYF